MIRSFVPRELGLSRTQQRAIERAAGRRRFAVRRNCVGMVVLTLVVLGVIVALPTRWIGTLGFGWVSPAFIAGVLGGLAGVSIIALSRVGLAKHVYAELRDRGHDVCPRCGYVLAGLDEIAPCPECGTLAAANLL